MRTWRCPYAGGGYRIWFDPCELASGRLDLQSLTAKGYEVAECNAALAVPGSPAPEILHYTGWPLRASWQCDASHGRHHGKLQHLRRVAASRREEREGGLRGDR